MKPALDFFFFYGSIYTYLAVMRIEELAASAGLTVRWRPFNLREILVEQNNTAFIRNPIRMNYSWRDVERRAARHGIEFRRQPPYPVDPDLLALRVGVVAAAEGWCADYTRATYRAWFLEHKAPGVGQNVEHVLTGLNKPVEAILTKAAAAETRERLAKETQAAREVGIFGSPNVVVGTELFWGDDRLEDAIDHALRAAPAPANA
jgi:2-hydroxychromene-2-carboxylate isomerase